MATVVVHRVIIGAELADIGVHAHVAIGLSMLVAHVARSRLSFGLDGVAFLILSIMCEVETFDRSGTLVTDVADDVGNSVSLVSKVTIGNVSHAEAAATGTPSEGW